MSDQLLDELLEGWWEDRLTEAEIEQLNGLLRSSGAARSRYQQEAELYGLLHVAVAEANLEQVTQGVVACLTPVLMAAPIPLLRSWRTHW